MSARAIVIGTGANELVAAHLLARGGTRVLAIEEHAGAAAEIGWAPPQVMRALGLERDAAAVERPDPWLAVPLPEGGRLELWQDVGRSAEAIRRLSPKDGAAWPGFCARMARLARWLERLYGAPPPDPLSLGFALRARRLGRRGIGDLLRLLPMSVADLLDDWFENDALKGALGAAGVLHLRQGPRSGGTAFLFLHHHVGCSEGVFRPPRTRLARVLRELPGIEVRAGAKAERIVVREGRVSGVVLANGEALEAPLVVSGADPRRTLVGLLDPGWLDPELARAARYIRCRGVAARVELALDRAPAFRALVLALSLDHLERAYDDAKYGRVSRQPLVEARSQGTRVELHVQYVPYEAAAGSELGDLALRRLAPHLDGAAVKDLRVLCPRDLEAKEGWPEGQPNHAELALDQAFWMRPLPELARYRSPVAGLYLCGPGMHPGGGVAGASGLNCAREILRGHARG
jgi:phytoene dehydrogenase-like protein